MWPVAFALVLIWWTWWSYRLSRDVIRTLESLARQSDPGDVLDSMYPVFSRNSILEAHRAAVHASRELQSKEALLYNDPTFKASTDRHSIPEEFSRRLLEVSEATVAAEKAWYWHSIVMDA